MAQYNIIALRSSGHQHHCVRCIFGAVTVKVNLQSSEIKEMYLSAFQFHIRPVRLFFEPIPISSIAVKSMSIMGAQ